MKRNISQSIIFSGCLVLGTCGIVQAASTSNQQYVQAGTTSNVPATTQTQEMLPPAVANNPTAQSAVNKVNNAASAATGAGSTGQQTVTTGTTTAPGSSATQPAAPQAATTTQAGSTASTTTTTTLPGAATTQKSTTMTRTQFIDQMGGVLKTNYCQKDSHFLTQFKINNQTCTEIMDIAIKDCSSKLSNQLPASVDQQQQVEQWAGKFGLCVGKDFRAVLDKQRTNAGGSGPTYDTKSAPAPGSDNPIAKSPGVGG